MSDRDRALDLLRRIERESLYASLLLIGESGFVRTLVLGVLRWRSRLDFAIEKLSGRRLNKIDAIVVDVLRIGIYQLQFMDIARYAAVSETVDLAGACEARTRVLNPSCAAPEWISEPPDLRRGSHIRSAGRRWVRILREALAIAIAEANQHFLSRRSRPRGDLLKGNSIHAVPNREPTGSRLI